jgi:hypothetical protein
MDICVVVKAGVLFFGIFFAMPILFFILVGCVGKGFSLSVDRKSWLGRFLYR